jgi:hypothetical protein
MSGYHYTGAAWHDTELVTARRVTASELIALDGVYLPLSAWSLRRPDDYRAMLESAGFLMESVADSAPWGLAAPVVGVGPDGLPAAVREALPEPLPEPDLRTPEQILADERAGMRADRLWCRVILVQSGLWDAIEAWAADPDRTAVERAFWEDARTWRRSDPIVAAVGPALGMTDVQIDDLFRAAMDLEATND